MKCTSAQGHRYSARPALASLLYHAKHTPARPSTRCGLPGGLHRKPDTAKNPTLRCERPTPVHGGLHPNPTPYTTRSRRSKRVIWFREGSPKEGDRSVAWYKLEWELGLSSGSRKITPPDLREWTYRNKSGAGLEPAAHRLRPRFTGFSVFMSVLPASRRGTDALGHVCYAPTPPFMAPMGCALYRPPFHSLLSSMKDPTQGSSKLNTTSTFLPSMSSFADDTSQTTVP